ncbi:MAG: hypothetical protein JSV73_01580, partial [Flavobacteriaceae bacterium]
MNHELKSCTFLSLFSLGLLISPSLAFSQQWGKEDQKGATNHITPEKVVQAANLISKGKIYELGQIYESSMPKGGRNFTLHIIGPPPIDESNKNSTVGNLDFFT